MSEQFGADRHHAKTPAGLEARMRSKLLGHVLGVYLNRLMGNPDPRKIKANSGMFNISSLTTEH